MTTIRSSFIALVLASTALVSLSGPVSAQAPQRREVILATTTSTQDSGLLDQLIPLFERTTGYIVKTIAVGSGQSLAMGARGDADVVLAHAPALERKYVTEGTFVTRRMVMHNDFVVVGPPADPARIRGLPRVRDVFARLLEAKAPFVSRGDKSGTHLLELSLWEKIGETPSGAGYIQIGQGMGAALNIASEKQAYTVTDRATYLALKHRLSLDILFEKERPLLNLYHVMEINPERFPRINRTGGQAFAAFLVGPLAQDIIRTFGVQKFGQPLFVPDAGKNEAEFDK